MPSNAALGGITANAISGAGTVALLLYTDHLRCWFGARFQLSSAVHYDRKRNGLHCLHARCSEYNVIIIIITTG